ncbi:MAG: 4Fe-4S dicluster domain-containing protein [Planctomycetota bacterium]|nr:4Fe-4S dicluster domain-containing protein [Planctomycetota bacterium]
MSQINNKEGNEVNEGMDRRDFLKTATAVGSGALLASCTPQEDSRFVSEVTSPYSDKQPPGAPWIFQSTCTECPANCGLEVKAYEKYDGKDRKMFPVKLEGLQGHPVNGADGKGNLCMRGQGALTRLYAPEKSNLMTFSLPKQPALLDFTARVQTPKAKNKDGKWQNISWEDAYARIRTALKAEGKKNAWLSGRTTGTLAGVVDAFCKSMNIEKTPDYEVYSHAAIRKANEILFGIADVPQALIGESDFLLTLGADILETHVSPISYTKQLTERRKSGKFSWYHLEPHVSLTGIRARDQRLVIQPASEPYLLAWLLSQHPNHKSLPKPVSAAKLEIVSQKTGLSEELLKELSNKLNSARKPLLLAGGVSTANQNGLETALLAGLIQWVAGMTNDVLDFNRTENYSRVGSLKDLENLSKDLAADKVGVLFVGWSNPAGTAPSSLALKENMKKATLRVAITEFMNDTAKECDVVLPLAHSLESEGDAEPRKGTWSRIRPVMKPLGDTRSAGDILLGLQGSKGSYSDHLSREWKKRFTGENAAKWNLASGGHVVMASARAKVQLGNKYSSHLKGSDALPVLSKQSIVVVPSLRTFDGRSSVLRLMEELPDPLSTISYGKWCAISENVAKENELEDRDLVELQLNKASAKLPIKVQPGLPDGIVMIQRDSMPELPFGISEKSGELSAMAEPVTVVKVGSKIRGNHMVVLSGSMSQENRGIIKQPLGTKAAAAEIKHPTHGKWESAPNGFYPPVGSEGTTFPGGKVFGHPHPEYDWAMSVDLDACTGCSACVAACYTENNIPMVGSWDHWKGREMSWLRIEPYKGPDGVPQFIPMMCQQCHNAPCEPVCPVYATMHTEDGLNAQVYNRCVGTRYCSNNCPYKVRRFNWWSHDEDKWEGNLKWAHNPEISIRTNGIMEKCTFCVQRIRKGKDHAQDEKRLVKDGEITPACAQTCPTGAITFGNLNDENSMVHKLSKKKKSYQVFEELGTHPSVFYLR